MVSALPPRLHCPLRLSATPGTHETHSHRYPRRVWNSAQRRTLSVGVSEKGEEVKKSWNINTRLNSHSFGHCASGRNQSQTIKVVLSFYLFPKLYLVTSKQVYPQPEYSGFFCTSPPNIPKFNSWNLISYDFQVQNLPLQGSMASAFMLIRGVRWRWHGKQSSVQMMDTPPIIHGSVENNLFAACKANELVVEKGTPFSWLLKGSINPQFLKSTHITANFQDSTTILLCIRSRTFKDSFFRIKHWSALRHWSAAPRFEGKRSGRQ